MKILSVTLFNNPTEQGGIESFVRILKKIYPQNISFITFNLKKDIKELYKVENLIKIGSTNIFFRISNRLSNNKLREILLLKKVKRLNPDIMIFSYPYEVNILSKIKAKKILVQHTRWSEYMRVFLHNKKNKKILEKVLDIFVVLSPYDKNVFCKGLNLDEIKVKVIRHSSQIQLLGHKKEKNRKLIMIARIDNHSKRFDLAIKAMKQLPEYTLDIYGDGPDTENCKTIIKNGKISNVFLKGSTNKVQEKLDESGIFIMTSDYEGYPIASIEAMRRGLPIVLRNTFEAAQDIVIDNGILLEKEWDEDKFVEAVRKVYANYEYYSENSKKLGKRHSLEVIKEEWDKILGEIYER